MLSGQKSIALVWYCKTPRGWRRFPVLYTTEHGRRITRHGWVKDDGQEQHYPDGRYQFRSFVDGRQKFENLLPAQNHPRDAVLAHERALRLAKPSHGQSGSLALLKVAAAAYIRYCKDRKASEAAEQARLVLDEFQKACDTQYTRAVTGDCVFRFHDALRKKGLENRTIANKHARLKSFFRFCKIDTSFMPPAPKWEKTLPTIYSPSEVSAIRKAGDEYMRMVVDMALMLGLRDQELRFASWTDIDWHHSAFRVQGKPGLGFAVKDSEQRDVPIPQQLLARLKDRHAKNPKSKLIIGTAKDTANTHLLRSLKRLARAAGLNCGQCKNCKVLKPTKEESSLVKRKSDPTTGQECERWTLHKFRRTYLTTLLRTGSDLRTVQAIAGHADLESTMRYLRPASTSEMQAKVNAIDWEKLTN